MGNRAVITFVTTKTAPCIYLHWHGGRASVEGFLKAAKALNLHAPLQEDPFCILAQTRVMDEFAETLAEFFFGTKVGKTVYRETYGRADADNWDNGVYVIDENFDIVARHFKRHAEEIDEKKTDDIYTNILRDIKERRAEEAIDE